MYTMPNSNLIFNPLIFSHRHDSLSFWFADLEKENICRIYHSIVPDEERNRLGELEHYYYSFDQKQNFFLEVGRKTKLDFKYASNEDSEGHLLFNNDRCSKDSLVGAMDSFPFPHIKLFRRSIRGERQKPAKGKWINQAYISIQHYV